MKTVKLIVTGDMEQQGLAQSLQSAFDRSADGYKVEFLKRVHRIDGVTTTPLLPVDVKTPTPSPVEKLVRTIAAELKKADGADYVCAIDDLELANFDHPERVTGWIALGVKRYLEKTPNPAARSNLAEGFRTRATFHLLTPLAEAYFFSSESALKACSVVDGFVPKLASKNVEDFCVVDPDYQATIASENAKHHEIKHHWYRHERHPKHYLDYAVGLRGEESYYSECDHGVPALISLDWGELAHDGTCLPSCRSLFQVFADLLKSPAHPNILDGSRPPGHTSSCTYPDKHCDPAGLVLINL